MSQKQLKYEYYMCIIQYDESMAPLESANHFLVLNISYA